MIFSRRVVVSLTPLLDLLLIVIFAQYVDLKGKSERTVRHLRQTSTERLDKERELRLKAERERDHAITLREETEKEFLRAALEKSRFNQTMAAELLNLSYHQFRGKLRKYGIEGRDSWSA